MTTTKTKPLGYRQLFMLNFMKLYGFNQTYYIHPSENKVAYSLEKRGLIRVIDCGMTVLMVTGQSVQFNSQQLSQNPLIMNPEENINRSDYSALDEIKKILQTYEKNEEDFNHDDTLWAIAMIKNEKKVIHAFLLSFK